MTIFLGGISSLKRNVAAHSVIHIIMEVLYGKKSQVRVAINEREVHSNSYIFIYVFTKCFYVSMRTLKGFLLPFLFILVTLWLRYGYVQ